MKKLLLFIYSGYATFCFSQRSINASDFSIAIQKNNAVIIQPLGSAAEVKITTIEQIKNNIFDGDFLVRFTSEITPNLSIKEGWVFYSGIQSPYNENEWICLERSATANDFNLFFYNSKSAQKRVLISNNATVNFAFRAVSWGAESNKVYLEQIVFDSPFEHEGIYSYDLSTGQLQQIPVTEKYMSTPVISPDRNKFIYTSTSDEKRELVHGSANQLRVFDINANKENIISQETGSSYQVLGWFESKLREKKNNLSVFKTSNTAQLPFKLPYVAGKNYCVTRDGSIAPTGIIGSGSTCSNMGPHSYPAATDFDTPNNANEQMLAVAAGTVTTVIYSITGYGNHVIITHADNYRTLYGHFFSIAVTQGQVVQQGCYLGMEGTTGNSSGDHLHFEYEYPGGSGNLYATFTDCGGCIPHRGYSYTSANSVQPCAAVSAPPPPTLSGTVVCGNKTLTRATPPSGVTYYWQGTACGTSTTNSAANYIVTTSGSYKLRARNSSGQWSSTCSSISVTVNQPPANPPSPTISANVCGPKTLTRSTPPAGVTYFWQTLCGTNTASAGTTYNAINSGTYRLRARTTAGCWSPTCSAVSVTVNATPSPSINGQNSVCNNALAVGYSVSNSGNNFLWSITGGSITSGQTSNSVTVNWGTSSSGVLSLTETNPTNGCSKTASLNVNISTSLNPMIFASGPTSFCQGNNVVLDASFGYTSYLWNTGATTQTILVANSGTYAVTVSASNGCTGYSSSNATVVVNPLPPTPTITLNDTVLASSSATGNQWYLDSVIISGETSSSIALNDNGYYSVVVTNSVTGCSSTSIPFFVGAVGMKETAPETDILVYPNPSNGSFTAKINSRFNSSELWLYDVLGRNVYSEKLLNPETEINLFDLPKGIYLLRLKLDEKLYIKKLILK